MSLTKISKITKCDYPKFSVNGLKEIHITNMDSGIREVINKTNVLPIYSNVLTNPIYMTLADDNYYAVFNINRDSDVIRNIRINCKLAENSSDQKIISTCYLTIGNCIIDYADEIVGLEWLPTMYLAYYPVQVYAKIDKNIISCSLTYEAGILPKNYRLLQNILHVEYYGFIYNKFNIIFNEEKEPDNIQLNNLLNKKKYEYKSLGIIRMNTSKVPLRQFGNAVNNILVKSNQKSKVLLKSNDIIIKEVIVDDNDKDIPIITTPILFAVFSNLVLEIYDMDNNHIQASVSWEAYLFDKYEELIRKYLIITDTDNNLIIKEGVLLLAK
jgi:hypothetical protein